MDEPFAPDKSVVEEAPPSWEPGAQSIRGYRSLNRDELYVINQIKETAELMRIFFTNINCKGLMDYAIDTRWEAIAKTHFQEGFMALNRAVARPDGF